MEDDKLILKPKRVKGDDGYRVFSVRLKEEMIAELDTIVAQTGYSRNELIARFLQYALDNCVIAND